MNSIVEGVTGSLTANVAVNLYDATGQTGDPLVRSFLVMPGDGAAGTLKVGYGTANTPLMRCPTSYPMIPGKWYDLRQVMIVTTNTGDTAVFSAVQ
jgi:hypothetical protein